MKLKNNEIENCNYVKAILMIIVVFYHSILFWNGNWFNVIPLYNDSKILAVFARWLNTFHIYCFTFISGYIFYYVKIEQNRYENFKIFLKKKISRLIIPYCCTAFFWVIPITQIFYKYTINEIMYKYIMATSPSQLWFLLMLFWTSIFFWYISENKNVKLILLNSMIFYLIGNLMILFLPNTLCIWTGLQYILFYALGYTYRKYTNLINRKNIGLVCLLFNIIFFMISEKISNRIIAYIFIQFTHILGAIGVFCILQIIVNNINNKKNIIISLLSKYSMTIYLFHQQIIYVVIYILNGKILPEINALINFFIAIILSLLISVIMSKNKITKKMFGIN